MSLSVTTDVFCDAPGCLNWGHGVSGRTRADAKGAREQVRFVGWTRPIVDGEARDICPAHSSDPEDGDRDN